MCVNFEGVEEYICLPNAYLRFTQMATKHYNALFYFLALEINKDQNLLQLKIQ